MRLLSPPELRAWPLTGQTSTGSVLIPNDTKELADVKALPLRLTERPETSGRARSRRAGRSPGRRPAGGTSSHGGTRRRREGRRRRGRRRGPPPPPTRRRPAPRRPPPPAGLGPAAARPPRAP